ncbi:hypothetical protein RFI_13187, partial [Reticulomyxa filosa]
SYQVHLEEIGKTNTTQETNKKNNKDTAISAVPVYETSWLEKYTKALAKGDSPILYDEQLLRSIEQHTQEELSKERNREPSPASATKIREAVNKKEDPNDSASDNTVELYRGGIRDEKLKVVVPMFQPPSSLNDISDEERKRSIEMINSPTMIAIHQTDNAVQRRESHFFPNICNDNTYPTKEAQYEITTTFSSIINAYKMAQVPSLLLSMVPEFAQVNQFKERQLILCDRTHYQEHLKFKVVLKPFDWASKIPVLNFLMDVSIVAHEDWVVNWAESRAEIVISNSSFRRFISVDEFCVIEKIQNTPNPNIGIEIYKALFVKTFIPYLRVPAIMFWKYTDYSDTYISVITKVAGMRCSAVK